MRAVAALLLAVLATALPAVAAPADTPRAIEKLKVIVRTGDDFGASTDEAVWFSLGPSYEWTLATPGRQPFKNGASDTFQLPPQGLRVDDIKYIRLRKSQGDDWLLRGIEVWIDGRPYYRNDEINLWLEGSRDSWSAPARERGR